VRVSGSDVRRAAGGATGPNARPETRFRYAVMLQVLAQVSVAVLLLVGGVVVVGAVVRALFAPNPGLALAERQIASAGASLGGAARQAGWETADGVWIQAGFRPRHGKPAEAITWIGRGAVPRLETQPMILLGVDGSVTSVDVSLSIPGHDERLAAVRSARLPMPVRLACVDDRPTGLVVTGWPTDVDVILRAVAVVRAL
jgi:hypothetical protein